MEIIVVLSHCFHQPGFQQQQAAVYSEEALLINPLYTCPAAKFGKKIGVLCTAWEKLRKTPVLFFIKGGDNNQMCVYQTNQ